MNLDWVAGSLAVIQVLASQSIINLKLFAGEQDETFTLSFSYRNRGLEYFCKFSFGVCLALVWYSQVISGPYWGTIPPS